MFYCTIYRPGGKTRLLGNSDWDELRKRVAEALKKQRDAKWGALRDDERMYVGRFRRSFTAYPKERPTEYMPDKELFTKGRRKILKLAGVAKLAGWPTPQVSDTKQIYGNQESAMKRWERSPYPSLAVYAKALGNVSNGCPASTGNGGQLNPELARWLMGYPAGWSNYAVTATRSIHTKRRFS